MGCAFYSTILVLRQTIYGGRLLLVIALVIDCYVLVNGVYKSKREETSQEISLMLRQRDLLCLPLSTRLQAWCLHPIILVLVCSIGIECRAQVACKLYLSVPALIRPRCSELASSSVLASSARRDQRVCMCVCARAVQRSVPGAVAGRGGALSDKLWQSAPSACVQPRVCTCAVGGCVWSCEGAGKSARSYEPF